MNIKLKCMCRKCLEGKLNEEGLPITSTMMIVCSICGNKRCPHASNHDYTCTNSNDIGQVAFIDNVNNI